MGKSKEVKSPDQVRLSSLESSLAVEAHHIRQVLREIAQHFVCEMESQAVHIIELASEIPDNAAKRHALDIVVQNMQKMEIRAEKGKLGDLKKIRDLLRDTTHKLEDLL
jgi:hypothetical protein